MPAPCPTPLAFMSPNSHPPAAQPPAQSATEADKTKDSATREALALASFDHVVSHAAGFRARAGQRDMAVLIAQTLSGVVPGDNSVGAQSGLPQRGIAVIQAGTGVGKSAAYAATVIPLAMAQKKRVIISTATVALQEQLISKDLPALAAALPEPFTFTLAKGRGRYICRLKLDQLAAGQASDLFESDESFNESAHDPAAPERNEPGISAEPASAHTGPSAMPWSQRLKHYQQWSRDLDSGAWDGDRDRLDDPPTAELWSPIAAERHSCTARHCPSYQSCAYYLARAKLAQSHVIVVNHDLLLCTLGLHALPAPQDCYLVFDEAHHLSAVAQSQFTASMDLTRSQWLDRLPRAVKEVADALDHQPSADVALLARELKTALAELARVAIASMSTDAQWADLSKAPPHSAPEGRPPFIQRFENGLIPPDWLDTLSTLQTRSTALLKLFESLATELKTNARENPAESATCARLYSRLGTLAPRLQSTHQTATLWLQDATAQAAVAQSSTPTEPSAAPSAPLAKWLQASATHAQLSISAHACPLQPGQLLSQQLWSHVRGAVVTSASLMSCGGFDHFLHQCGLAFDPAVVTREVQSPFDHASQARLLVVHTQADPKHVEAFTGEMLAELTTDLAQVQRGALVLFTSKAQMRRAQELLEQPRHSELRPRVLVQGQAARAQLLRWHAQRIAAGTPSILFGLQSFGEGLDLPGALCEWLFITKLPFASPNDPVSQAQADWLKSQGRDPFNELVVPATGARLLQWTGRAIRTEADQAVVICYDARLLRQAYGRRMLKGLPPYRLEQRRSGIVSAVNPS